MDCAQLESLVGVHSELGSWLEKSLNCELHTLQCQPLSGDASFRCYFRILRGDASFMLAIAPPATEKNTEFVAIAKLLRASQILVPQILAVNYAEGYILQQDLGDEVLQPLLTGDAIDYWYSLAIEQLQLMASVKVPDSMKLAAYTEDLLFAEMELFTQWFLPQLLGVDVTVTERDALHQMFSVLIASAQAQPQVFVHRDYHCRNLMAVHSRVSEEPAKLATIDFQDAVIGPITYDAVSLLKDCYVVRPKHWVEGRLQDLYQGFQHRRLLVDTDYSQFQRDFHLMGLQRHIKVLGIFARLSLRDNKHGYLADLSTVVRYVSEGAGLYPDTADFKQWFDNKVLPVAKLQSWWSEDA